jgi:hypothetical protein
MLCGSHGTGYEDFCILEHSGVPSVDINGHFGGICCLQLQVNRLRQIINQYEADGRQSPVPPKFRLIFDGIHGSLISVDRTPVANTEYRSQHL